MVGYLKEMIKSTRHDNQRQSLSIFINIPAEFSINAFLDDSA